MNDVEILLVEDDPDDTEFALRALQAHNITNDVKVIADGAEAMEYIFGEGRYGDRNGEVARPKVILLDLKLPLVDGHQVLQRIKGDTRTRRTPVVVLTSSLEDIDRYKSYDLGANSYIVKPVDFARFSDAMREVGLYWLLLNEPPPPPEHA